MKYIYNNEGKSVGKLRSVLGNRKGMTMTNVIVAFVILMMMVSLFTGVAIFTNNAVQRSDSEKAQLAKVMEDYYLGKIDGRLIAGTDNIGNIKGSPEFTLTDGVEEIKVKSSVYSYTEDNMSIYTYGPHLITEELINDENS